MRGGISLAWKSRRPMEIQTRKRLSFSVGITPGALQYSSRLIGIFVLCNDEFFIRREWVGVAVVQYIMTELITQYKKDDALTRALDYFDFTIIPVLNVDGYIFTQKDRMVIFYFPMHLLLNYENRSDLFLVAQKSATKQAKFMYGNWP